MYNVTKNVLVLVYLLGHNPFNLWRFPLPLKRNAMQNSNYSGTAGKHSNKIPSY